MICYSKNNIYLCDLSYLGAEVGELESGKSKQIVTVAWPGHEPYRLMVEACNQGWHVVKGLNVSLEEIAGVLEKKFEARDLFPYFCFAKIREAKMRVTRIARVVLLFLSALWLYKFVFVGGMNYAIMAVLALLMSFVTLFLPREILKRTFEDFMADEEREGGPGPLDFHDFFN